MKKRKDIEITVFIVFAFLIIQMRVHYVFDDIKKVAMNATLAKLLSE